MDFYNFYKGQCFDAYEFFGAHVTDETTWFRTYAPAANRVAVIGEFNGWNETPMDRAYDGSTWECSIPDARPGQMYKYRIYGQDGRAIDHCDPYGFGMELRPNSASVIRELRRFEFDDWDWMLTRTDRRNESLNIYEVHAGSWHKNPDDPENGWYNYVELGDLLIPYVREHGYNYIEFLPLAEHPSDNSWGYQNTGFFAPTSRYGTMDQLKQLIENCHKNEIGVILDFVPVHFAVDDYALERYDGTALYEYPHPDMGYSEWGSHNFNHCKGEVQSFLQSNANYWLKEFHFDGLRIDALSNLIYWQGNKDRGTNENAVHFIRNMNGGLKKLHPTAILAAEDSTQFPGVTRPVYDGGLGFDYKWDMGWMNDSLDYMKKTADQRTEHYHKLTFSMMYFYDENFILPLSHDEVVHGKATILQKMSGLYEGKFPQARTFYMYMYAHPGKKLNFMGNEFAQIREWDEDEEQDWFMLRYPLHDSFQVFMKDLSHLYLDHPAFWALDYNTMGFDWVDCNQAEKRIYAFVRHGGEEDILCLFNFSEKAQDYRLRLDYNLELELLLASDADIYSGTEHYEGKTVLKKKKGYFELPMTPYSAKFFKMK
ncbi:MAG: 1,4-alpha-glucan branching protein GlgB [Clostridia bacterium]|nr:1,4-alpha-glucan branching protein GlgB [Clostridia bacterium]